MEQGMYDDAVPFLQRAAQLLSVEFWTVEANPTPRAGERSHKLHKHKQLSAVPSRLVRDSPALHSSPSARNKQVITAERTRFRVVVAKCLIRCGRAGDAVPLLLQVLWEEKSHPEVLWLLATHYIREGLVDMASNHLQYVWMLAMLPVWWRPPLHVTPYALAGCAGRCAPCSPLALMFCWLTAAAKCLPVMSFLPSVRWAPPSTTARCSSARAVLRRGMPQRQAASCCMRMGRTRRCVTCTCCWVSCSH